MVLKTLMIAAATAATLSVAVVCPASAGGMHGGSSYTGGMPGYSGGMGTKCKTGGGVNIYKPVTINKNININKNVNVYKPVTIEKNINITNNIDNSKNININKNVNINKDVNINKNININKVIVINKGGSAQAEASAFASASANANAQASSVSYSAAYSESTVINHNGGGGEVAVAAQETCQMQEATVVKALHIVCVTPEGREFPASHMLKDTWVESGYEGEVARCIPGATIKAVIGDVVQSDEGMAGTYSNGQVLSCGMHEALRHFKDGMLKCAAAVPVKDCTERTNLRLYGTGDFFFSYRTQVCATMARKADSATELTGMALDGGVGGEGN